MDYRTPFWDKRERILIVRMWDIIFEKAAASLPGRLAEVEREQREKIGPISLRKPLSARMPEILGYFNNAWPSVDLEAETIQLTDDLRLNQRLRPLSHQSAAEELAWNTNSGYPSFTRRKLVVEEGVEDAISGKYLDYPAVLGWRGTASGMEKEPKQRTVWMMPMSFNVREMAYFRPIQRLKLQNASYLSAWTTPETVDAAVQVFLRACKEAGCRTLSTDFSSFDQSVGPSLQYWSFLLKKRAFQEEFYEDLSVLEQHFSTISLMIGQANVLSGVHGVPSGSVFTNDLDGDVHRLAQLYVARRWGTSLVEGCQVQGDDGLIGTRSNVDSDRITLAYRELGLSASAEKQFEGVDDCMYLQRYHKLGYSGGMYSTYRALNSLLGQERFYDPEIWGADMVTLRAIMILENCKHHPLHRELVHFVQSGDALRLGAAYLGGIDALLGNRDLLSRARGLAGFVPSYNQEDRIGGVRNFATYKIIKESENA